MTDIPYKIICSDRKTIALVINSEAKLTARAPFDAKESEIISFIKKKKRWILDKQKKISALNNKHSPVSLKNGGSFLYQGNNYTIKTGGVSKIQISGENLILPKGCKKEKVIAWLKREAKKLIFERLDKYSSLMRVSYQAVRISSARTRWGSCSGKNNLNFTWRLIMCPLSAIDYVIIHELCHLKYKNHSPAFWEMVKKFYPKFKEQKKWLKTNRKIMDII
jgi:predicted metal-dependent hydrolase